MIHYRIPCGGTRFPVSSSEPVGLAGFPSAGRKHG